MRKLVLLAVMVSSLSSCSLFSGNSDPKPGQEAESTQSRTQPCHTTVVPALNLFHRHFTE